ncbi:MAG: bifunctional phosphopantothenoylcysteine decarboxylase/phosphopantothenate--cysteine ligase CoaBC [Fimbriimonadaceae bacterium]
MPNVVLGVSGSIAAYRAADLARELMRAGWTVRACLTDSAEKFVSRQLFEALTGQPCLVSSFDEPDTGRMAHIDWARQADLMMVAPATANVLNKLANGVADDMLTTLALAFEGPFLLAPAMNPSMYAHDTTQASIRTLSARGAIFVEPESGDVACGEQGQGKLASIERIVSFAETVRRRSRRLSGKRVLITAGPTQEPIDDVRYLTNRSSGKMGIALARAALLMGAEVDLVCGPTSEPLPLRADVARVRTAEEMLEAARSRVGRADWIIGAAAVADFRPAEYRPGKIRRSGETLEIRLVPNPDVLAELARAARAGTVKIGFAAEPDPELDTAVEKLRRKGLDAIAVNDVSRDDIGFDVDSNELTLLFADGGREASGRQPKLGCGLWLLEQVASRLQR